MDMLQCCDQHRVPDVPHHIPHRNWIRGTYQNRRGNVKIGKTFRLLRNVRHFY